MEDNKFWIAVWRIVATVVIAFILVAGGCNMYRTDKITSLIENGTNPIEAHCAIIGFGRDVPSLICYETVK